MKNQNTAIMDDQEKCGASVADAIAVINSLTNEEKEELVKILLEKYGMAVARFFLIPQN